MALSRIAFARVRKTLDAIKRDTPKHARARFAQYCNGQIKRGIVNGVTPYGAPFKALAASTVRKKGHGKPLYETGTLLAGAGAKETSRGVSFTDGTRYGSFHLGKRPWLPTHGLPARWRAELKRIIKETLPK